MSKTKKPKHDIYQEVTDNIIKLLEQVDMKEYQPPFAQMTAMGIPENPLTQNPYQGVNILNLWFNQAAKSFQSNQWATFKQWKELGANVKKGEKGTGIIFYKTLLKEEENTQGQTEEKRVPMARRYTVFNADQVTDYDITLIEGHQDDLVKPLDLIDTFTKHTKADIRVQGTSAFYSPEHDHITMPHTHNFKDTSFASATEHYYNTLLHEMTHWTGAKHRLDREGINPEKPDTKQSYAFEELIAELGAAFLCAQFNILQTHPHEHAVYIKNWLAALKNDKKWIFKAAAQANKAAEYLNTLQPQQTGTSTGKEETPHVSCL